MRKLIKIFTAATAVCVMLVCLIGITAHADGGGMYDFIDFAGNMSPLSASMKTTTGGFGEYKTETVDGVYRDYYNFGVERTEDTSSSDEHLQYTKYRDFSRELEFSYELRFTEETSGSLSFSLRHNGSNTNSMGTLGIISYNPSNLKATYLSSYGISASETLEKGVWYKFKIYFNLPEDTITVYRDGELKATAHNTRTYSDKLKQFNYEQVEPRFQAFVSGTKVGTKVSFDIDRVELVENGSLNENYFITNRKFYTYVSGEEHEAEYIRNGKFKSSVSVENKSQTKSLKATLAVGRFTANGEMTAFYKSDTCTIEPGKTVVPVCEFAIENIADGDYIRTFIIDDLNNMSPLSTYAEYPESLLNPYGVEVVEAVYKNYPDNSHPRLLMNREKLEFLAKACYEQEPYKTWYARIKNSANNIINKGFAVYDDLDELRLSSAGTVGGNITSLAFVYAIENAAGNPAEKYAKRIVDEMINVSVENPEWADWNPKHFLDTSAILVGYGYAYDWCYDYFNRPENAGEKEMMFNTLKQYGLDAADLAYKQISNYWWTNTNNNWNMVCNAGVALASLAVCDEEEFKEITPYLLESGLKSARKCFADFAPDGAWFEGTGYWHYTVNLMSVYFSSLQVATGSDYDYMDLPGISTTGFFPIAMTGRNGTFNLNDANAGNLSIPELWYFANQFNDTTLAKYRYYQLTVESKSPTYKDIVWYNEELLGEDKDDLTALLSGMKADSKYSGVEIATFRDGFFTEGKYFVGFHGGKNGINHGHIDAGSFIYDAKIEDGTETRWAIDIGSENYNLHNMFGGSSSSEKSRWAYYRNRGEGHNTIIINPGILADQPLDTTATISDFKSAAEYGYSILDMQPIYGEYTSEAYRGVYFNRINGGLMVRDEITFNDEYTALDNNLYWFMHTKAEIELAEDGKSAILTQNEQRLWVGIIDGNQTFTVMDATPLPTSPNPDEWEENIANDGSSTNPKTQNANLGIRKLAINDSKAGEEWKLSVYMVLLGDEETEPSELPENIELSNWN